MIYREFIVFFCSFRNIRSLFLTLLSVVILYTIFLQMASDEQRIIVFFESFYVNVPTLVFYLIYFKDILKNGVLRFNAINLERSTFWRYLLVKIVVAWLVCVISVGALYFILYLPYGKITTSTAILKFLYYTYFQLFECLFCFVLLSLFKNTWIIFAIILYAMSENSLILILESKGLEFARNIFPFQTFKNIIEFNNSPFNIFSFLYLAILIWAVFNLKYRRL